MSVVAAPAAARTGRVLALVSDGFGAPGGIAAYNRELLGALAASPGVDEVRVLARRGDGAGAPSRVMQTTPRGDRAGFAAAALAQGLRRRYDWVFCGHLHLAGLARGVATVCGAGLWCQAHGIEAWRAPGAPARAALGAARLVTAVSRATRSRLLAWAHVHPSRVRVLANAFDPRFTSGKAPAALRERLDAGERPVLLTVSRLDTRERYKGHEVVMQALRLPALAGPGGPVYVIAGDGDDRARLEARARDLGVAQRVRFLGAVAADALPGLYRAADVFVMPSTGEGFGIVFLEAAASGVPVVAGDGDGSRDALRDGRVGRLVDARDPGAVAAAVVSALSDPQPPRGFEVFRRACFREHLERVLATCPPPSAAERWR